MFAWVGAGRIGPGLHHCSLIPYSFPVLFWDFSAGHCKEESFHEESKHNGSNPMACLAVKLYQDRSMLPPYHFPHLCNHRGTFWGYSVWQRVAQNVFLVVVPIDETTSVAYSEPFDCSPNLSHSDHFVPTAGFVDVSPPCPVPAACAEVTGR